MLKKVKIGIEVEVPEECKYVAVDKYCSGVYTYTEKPDLQEEEWGDRTNAQSCVLVTNWYDTLTEVEHDEGSHWAKPEETPAALSIAAHLMRRAEEEKIDMTLLEYFRLGKICKMTQEPCDDDIDFLLAMVLR